MRIPTLLLALVAVLTMVAGGQAAANLLINGGFEDPIGSEWQLVVTYTNGTGFSISAPTATAAHSGGLGAQFQVPTTNNWDCEAYYRQVITGQVPGTMYNVSAWIKYAPLAVYNRPDKYWAYLKATGGMAGTLSMPAKGAAVTANTWVKYTFQQTADGNGDLEIRVGMWKYATTSAKQCDAFIDDVVVEAVPEPSSLIALLSGMPVLGFLIRRK